MTVHTDDRDRFEAVFPELYRSAYRIAYRLLGNDSDAQEIAAETLTRVYVRWPRVAGHVGPWAATVATNLVFDCARRATRARDRLPAVASKEPRSDPDSELRLDVRAMLSALPTRQRQVLVLRYLLDMSEEQVAAALDISVGSVKTHLSRGRDRARSIMEEPT